MPQENFRQALIRLPGCRVRAVDRLSRMRWSAVRAERGVCDETCRKSSHRQLEVVQRHINMTQKYDPKSKHRGRESSPACPAAHGVSRPAPQVIVRKLLWAARVACYKRP